MVSLAKGQTVSLSKMTDKALTSIKFGVGWDAAKKQGGGGLLSKLFKSKATSADSIDLDASCILFDAQGVMVDSIWFRQLASHCGSVVHSGDNRTGDGDGDDEVINVQLNKLPATVETLVLTVNSFTGQTFNEVDNAYCRVIDETTGKELARYSLSDQGSHTGIIVAWLQRDGGQWSFKAVGERATGRTVKDMAALAQQLLGK